MMKNPNCHISVLIAFILWLLPSTQSAAVQPGDINAAMLDASRRGDFKAVQSLLDRGANPNARDNQGHTALMTALAGKRESEAAFWERQKIDVNASDRNGATLLMYAATAGEPDRVAFLLDHGARINARDHEGRTALMATVTWSGYDVVFSEDAYVQIVERLLTHGAEINAQDRDGRTALSYAG
jgi:ankyrin repeat protein